MTERRRTWIASIAGIVAVMLVVYLSPTSHYQARGILLPAQKTRSPIAPDKVVQLPSRPDNGIIMGYINIQRHYPASDRTAHQDIARFAQIVSAQVGANAFVVNLFRIGQVTSTQYIYVFQATAYYVPMLQRELFYP